MELIRWRRFTIGAVLILFLASACTAGDTRQPPTSTLQSSTPTQVTLTPSRSQPTLTPVPATPTSAPTEVPPPETWDLVIFSDSSLVGVGAIYARYIEEDLGVAVRLHDLWRGGFRAVDLLKRLQTWEDWREIVRGAEAIVYFGNPIGSQTGDWDCVTPEYYARDCAPETFENYRATLAAIVEEIQALRDGKPTIIRATDFYSPLLSEYREAGVQDECMQCFINMNEAVHLAAAAYNIPVASVFEAFNGSNHDEDPREKGYIGFDEIHTNEAGQKVIADLLRALGYEPVLP